MEVSIYTLHRVVFVWDSKYSKNIFYANIIFNKYGAKYQFLMLIIEYMRARARVCV